MMSEEELTSVGVNTRALHKHYMNHAMNNNNNNDNNLSIVGEFKAHHLHSGPGFFLHCVVLSLRPLQPRCLGYLTHVLLGTVSIYSTKDYSQSFLYYFVTTYMSSI